MFHWLINKDLICDTKVWMLHYDMQRFIIKALLVKGPFKTLHLFWISMDT